MNKQATPESTIDPSTLAARRPLRAALAMERNVGHTVQATEVERHLKDLGSDLETLSVPVTFYDNEGLLERLPLMPQALRAAWRARLEVKRGIRDWQPDVIFWNTQKPAVLCTDLLMRIPAVISLDVTPRQYDREIGHGYGHTPDGDGPVAAAKDWWNRRVFHLAKRLLPWSAWATRSLIDDYGVAPEAIEVLSPGADLARFYPPAHGRRSRADAKTRLLFVGGDFNRKGGDTLLQWFRSSPTARRCVLDIVTRDAVESCDGVTVHRLSNEDQRLPELFREADVFVMPTKAECFGIVFAEAAASALPIVSCDVGGVGEVVRDGENGLMVRPGDPIALEPALAALVADPALREDLGRRGRALAEARFDSKKNVGRLAEILREVVEIEASPARDLMSPQQRGLERRL